MYYLCVWAKVSYWFSIPFFLELNIFASDSRHATDLLPPPPPLVILCRFLLQRIWKTHSAFVFGSRTLFAFPCSAIWKSDLQYKGIVVNAGRVLLSLWYVHMVNSCQGYLCYLFGTTGCCSERMPGNAGEQLRAVPIILFCSSVIRSCSHDAKVRGTSTHSFCNITWSEWNLVDLTLGLL